jgi:DNA repair protein RadA/Sms
MRARRLGLGKSAVPFQAEIQLEKILRTLEDERPVLCVIDSIQTIWSDKLTAAPGGVSQVKECGAQLARCAKALGIAVVLVGHVTKEGDLAGPRVLEHQVDCSLMFQGDPNSNYRLIRALKNRFGAVNELAVLHMSETGLKPVSNPSAIFLSNHDAPVPGSCVMATIDGTRPMLVEIQSLVDSGGPSPRRLTIGLERDRLSMLLAVLNRHGGIQTSDQDVFVNAVGGMKISEPAADLSVILAIHSSIRGKPLPRGVLCFGEVGLAGEVRPAPKGFERINEAAKLGFTHIILPKANMPKKRIPEVNLYPVSRIEDALGIVINDL